MRLLVTGFPAFPGQPNNPTQNLVELIQAGNWSLPGLELVAELLPVEYAAVEREAVRCLEQHQPDVWLAFGVSRRPEALQLELTGRNRDHAERPDNSGEVRLGSPIVANGPGELHSALDLPGLQEFLLKSGVDVTISQDAGAYVCNHLQYFGLWHLSQFSKKCQFLFTHVAPPELGLPTEKLALTLQIMAGWFQNRHTAARDELT